MAILLTIVIVVVALVLIGLAMSLRVVQQKQWLRRTTLRRCRQLAHDRGEGGRIGCANDQPL